MKRHLAVLVVAAVAVVVGAASAAAEEEPGSESGGGVTELEQVSAYTEPSVVYVAPTWTGYVYDTYNKRYLNDEEPLTISSQCTGYVVHPDGYIATAGHCVNPEDAREALEEQAAQWALQTGYYLADDLDLETVLGFDDYVVINEEGKRNRVDLDLQTAWGVSAGGVQTGKALPARVLKWQKFEEGDGAILKVEASDLNALPLADETLDVGAEIVAVGYPASVDLVADATFSPSFKEGTISSTKTLSGGLSLAYEISAAMSGGMSGGPTVNLDGEVVGFNSFGINSQVETQQFNFVRPAKTIQELLADTGTDNELSEVTMAYRDGLDALFAGDKEAAVSKLQFVFDEQPTNEFAKEYLDEANALPDPPNDEAGFPLLPLLVGLGAALVLVVVTVALLLVRGRRSRRSTPSAATAYASMAGAGVPSPAAPAPAAPAPAASAPAVPAPPAPARSAPSPMPPDRTTTDRGDPAGPASNRGQPAWDAPTMPVRPPSPAAGDEHDHHLFCGRCGARHEAGQRFCKECGTAL